MIPLDWKFRLEQDTEDFYLNKLPKQDYDFDLIYNAYPKRIEGQVPKAVITLVAKNLAGKLAKQPKDYLRFYEYVWEKKGEAGKLAVSTILNRVAKKDEYFFLDFIFEKLLVNVNDHEAGLVLEKVMYPFAKKNPQAYLDYYFKLLQNPSNDIKLAVLKMLIKIAKVDAQILKPIQQFLENSWYNIQEEDKKIHIFWMKQLYSVDPEFYINVYRMYRVSRDPAIADILAHSVRCDNELIDEMVSKWANSGNVHLKKAGTAGVKIIKKFKKK